MTSVAVAAASGLEVAAWPGRYARGKATSGWDSGTTRVCAKLQSCSECAHPAAELKNLHATVLGPTCLGDAAAMGDAAAAGTPAEAGTPGRSGRTWML